MPREVYLYLYDIVAACDLIMSFVAGLSLSDYESSAIARSAVERQFILIGEALARATEFDPSLRDRFRSVSKIVSFRNRLVHVYSDISAEQVWGAIQGPLQELRAEAASILEAHERQSGPQDGGHA